MARWGHRAGAVALCLAVASLGAGAQDLADDDIFILIEIEQLPPDEEEPSTPPEPVEEPAPVPEPVEEPAIAEVEIEEVIEASQPAPEEPAQEEPEPLIPEAPASLFGLTDEEGFVSSGGSQSEVAPLPAVTDGAVGQGAFNGPSLGAQQLDLGGFLVTGPATDSSNLIAGLDVEAGQGGVLRPPAPSPAVLDIRERVGALGLAGFCPLSGSLGSTGPLVDLLRARSFASQRVPVEAYGPCEELLTFEATVEPPSILVQLEFVDVPSAQESDASALVATWRGEAAALPALGESTLIGGGPVGGINLREASRIARADGRFALIDAAALTFGADALDAGSGQDRVLINLTGFEPQGGRLWVITVNAGADPTVPLATVYGALNTALLHMADL